jgi:hypothetical protein
MQRFSEEEALQQFDEAIALTMRIRQLLESDASDMDTISDLYDKRTLLLEQLANWKRFVPIGTGEAGFRSRWDERASALMDCDREVVTVLGTLKHTYQEKLRENMQKKYLLIYSKG